MGFSDVYKVIQSAPFGFMCAKSVRNDVNQLIDLTFKESNDAFYALFGINNREIENKNYSSLCNSLRLSVFGDRELFFEHVNAQATSEFEFFFAPKNKWIRVHYHHSEAFENNDFHFIFYDVTSNKRLKLETESFFNFSFDILLIFNPEGLILKANNTWGDTCLYNSDELEGKNFLLWVHPDDLKNTEKAFNFLREVGVLDSFMLRFRCKNGEFVNLQMRAKMNNNNVYASFRDVSDQLKKEAIVRASEEQYRLLSENTTDVIWTMNLEGEFTYVSPSVQKLRGFSVDEVMKQQPHEILCSGSLEYLSKGLKSIKENLLLGLAIPKEIFVLEQPCKDGTSVWTEAIVNGLVNSSGETIGIIGVSRNIHDRKRTEDALRDSEERMRVIFDTSNIGISIVDLDGRYQTFNAWWEHFLGYHSDELKTKTNLELTHPNDVEESKVLFDKAVHGEIDNYRIEKRYVRKDGEIVWGDASVSVIRKANGEISHLAGMVLDINEKKWNEFDNEYQLRFQQLISEISTDFLKISEFNFDENIQRMLQKIGHFYKQGRQSVYFFGIA